MFKSLLLLLTPLTVVAPQCGCELFEPLYVSTDRTRGAWIGTDCTIEMITRDNPPQKVAATAFHIESGPPLSPPAHRGTKKNVVAWNAVLSDENNVILAPDTFPDGAKLRVRGLMWNMWLTDQQGRPLHTPDDVDRKWIVFTIQVKDVEVIGQPSTRPTTVYTTIPRPPPGGTKQPRMLLVYSELTEPTTSPTTSRASQPSLRLWAKAVSDQQIDTWWDPVEGAVQYRIDFSIDGEDFFDSATMDASQPRCSNADLDPDKEHFFRVTALGPDEKILAVSNVASARTFPDPRADEPAIIPVHPDVPMRLWVKPISHQEIDIWWDQPLGAKAYRIERSSDGKDFVAVRTIDAGTARFSCVDLSPDQQYVFRVTALGANEQVLKISNVRSATTLSKPP